MSTPDSSSADTKRMMLLLLGSFLMLSGWTVYQSYFAPPPPALPAPEPAIAAATEFPASASEPAVGVDPSGVAPVAAVSEGSPRRVQVSTPLWRVEASNVGGRLTSWKLLEHGEYGDRAQPVELVRRRLPPEATPADAAVPGVLVASDAQDVLPLQVFTGNLRTDRTLATALHAIEVVEIAPGEHAIEMKWSDGVTAVSKRIIVTDNSPVARVEAQLSVNGRPASFHLQWGPGLGNHTPLEKESSYFRQGEVAWWNGDDLGKLISPEKSEKLAPESVKWAAIQDSFFAAIFIPEGARTVAGSAPGVATGFFVGGELPVNAKGKTRKKDWPQELILHVPFTPEQPAQALFVGPRERRLLEMVGAQLPGHPRLPQILDYGILQPIVVPMHELLLWLHAHAGSWAAAIILLTLIVRAALFPFTHISLKKMRTYTEKLKPVQPQIKAVQERYKKLERSMENQQKMQQEVMALHAKAGVSPFDPLKGCLPMLLSMPFLFALFMLLPRAPEFRYQMFLFPFWPDLASPDGTHVWPILFILTSYAATLAGMAGSPQGDPMQRNMMYVFPLMIGIFCWSAPLGLVVYWTVSNVVQVGQQFLVKLTLRVPIAAADSGGPTGRSTDPPATAPVTAPAVVASGKARKKGRSR